MESPDIANIDALLKTSVEVQEEILGGPSGSRPLTSRPHASRFLVVPKAAAHGP